MSDLDAILDGLRGKAVPTIDEYTAEPDQPHVPLSDAVAAVHAAADARTQEICDALMDRGFNGDIDAETFIARRFPNEGTTAPHGAHPAHERGGRA